jgi:ABC-type nickel/cobalt efflux system permease component RcnA
MELATALVLGAVGIASLHALAPDHWLPFAALARAQRWSGTRTVLVTAACGAGHVLASVAVAMAGLVLGIELFAAFGRRLEGIAGLLLIGFGLAYAAWGIGRTVRSRLGRRARLYLDRADTPSHVHDDDDVRNHDDWHLHHHHHHDLGRATAWSLFLLFCADPCAAVIPLMFAAAPLGWPGMLSVVAGYLVATVATMVALVLPARAAATAVRGRWADRYGDILAGGVIATIGIVVNTLGI